MSNIICRVHYCENCARRRSPHYGDPFLAYGSARNDYVVYQSIKESTHFTWGFTPHLYQMLSVSNGMVHFLYACSLYGCDCQREQQQSGTYFYYIPSMNWKEGSMPLKEWNALLKFKNTGYQI